MNISQQNLTIRFGKHTIFEDIDYSFHSGHIYGLLGINGSGKTTLLDYIYKNHNNDNIRISLLEQELCVEQDKTPYDILLESDRELYSILTEYNKLDSRSILTNEELNNYNNIQEKLVSLNYEELQATIREILFGLGFNKDLQEKPYISFSGGWRMRISLARMLYNKDNNILLLDEPTNHLDLEASIWLSDYLKHTKKCNSIIILVSHDITFIKNICTRIVHIENNKLSKYKGGYDHFLEEYNKKVKEREKKWCNVQKEVKGMQRKGTPKAQVQKFLEEKKHLHPVKQQHIRMYITNPQIIAPQIDIYNISFGYPKRNVQQFDNASVTIESGEHIILVGANGVGKSTLLKLITGELVPLSGKISVPIKELVGYYEQDGINNIPINTSPIDYIQSVIKIGKQKIHQYLGCFDIPSDSHTLPFSNLSGGQKSRVYLLSILLRSPSILLLDEPTNHMDMETIKVLIDSLNNYEGTIISITHNLYFIEHFESTILEIADKTIYQTTFEEYQDDVLTALKLY